MSPSSFILHLDSLVNNYLIILYHNLERLVVVKGRVFENWNVSRKLFAIFKKLNNRLFPM